MGVPTGCVVRPPGNQINGELGVDLVENFQRFPEALALKRQDHEQIDIRVLGLRAVGIGPEKDDFLGVAFARDALG